MGRLLQKFLVLAAVMLLISSCATLSGSGVGRVKRYEVESGQLPSQFDGYTVAFVSDLHYPSLFSPKRLAKLVRHMNGISPDLLLLGGDYVTDNAYIDELFSSISSVKTADGRYAVLGNHEKRNGELISSAMNKSGIVLLSDDTVHIRRGGESIYLAGVEDSFKFDSTKVQPAEMVDAAAFVMLLCHTPDYAERSSTTADLVLSGHTHGGQVSLLGIYTPVRNSAYGTRFLRGRNRTSEGSTVITTNGVGTSRKKVRFCVPSEIVVVTLRSEKE